MPISTYKSFLMQKTAPGTTWTKLVDIKEFPDLGGDPEMLETTTLSDKMQTYIAGIQSMDGLSFTANYTLADYKTLKAKRVRKRIMPCGLAAQRPAALLPPPALTESFPSRASFPCTPPAAA